MKIRTITLIMATFVFSLTACNDTEKKSEKETVNTEEAATSGEKDLGLKVNPQHGLPGHRCDLPVGAPLDGSQPAATQTTTTPAQPVSTSVSPILVDQKPDKNPPHGEPYHDCTIPVGADLKK